MAQSLVKNYVHIVFSTKNREKVIHPPHEKELHSYIVGICSSAESHAVIVGGYTDHIHILCNLSRKIALMTLIQKIKANSSRWFKTLDVKYADFKWQNGYGSFSVNPHEIDLVIKYIQNQHQHHQNQSFKEEYVAFLKKYDMEFDERYVWE